MTKKHKKEIELENDKWVEGILKTKEQIIEFLKTEGVEEIDCLDQEFDPNLHEAVEMIDSDSESGIIIKEINKGYTLHEKVIRPSRVKVSK